MKINNLFEIENIDTLCYYKFHGKSKYVRYQHFVVKWCYFRTENRTNFSIHTATVK